MAANAIISIVHCILLFGTSAFHYILETGPLLLQPHASPPPPLIYG